MQTPPPTTAAGRVIWTAIRDSGPIGVSDLHFLTMLDDREIRDHIRLHRDLYACIVSWPDGIPLRRYFLAPQESQP